MKFDPWKIALLILLALLAGMAWAMGSIQDDAFITFRYSRHLAEGLGPVFNPGEPVEGYTNFLWMLVMVVPIYLGLDPVPVSQLLGLLAWALSQWLFFRLLCHRGHPERNAFFWTLAYSASSSMLITSTSGLESSSIALGLVLGLYALSGNAPQSWGKPLVWGLLAAALLMLRPDSALLLLLLGALCLRQFGWQVFLRCLPGFGLVVAGWLSWKLSFYGHLLPNTFYAKVGGTAGWQDGLAFWLAFALVHGLFWALLLLPRLRSLRLRTGWMAPLLAFLALWSAYIIAVGGDYLNFRLMGPAWLVAILFLAEWSRADRDAPGSPDRIWRSLPLLLGGTAFVLGLAHGNLFQLGFVKPAWVLTRDEQHLSFVEQGKRMGNLLEQDRSIRLGIGATGAIPWYTRFYTVDLYGLTASEIREEAKLTGFGPGHAKVLTWEALMARELHLISLSCAQMRLIDRLERQAYATQELFLPMYEEELAMHVAAHPEQLTVLELPLDDGFYELCLYLRPHPRIEKLIEKQVIAQYPLFAGKIP